VRGERKTTTHVCEEGTGRTCEQEVQPHVWEKTTGIQSHMEQTGARDNQVARVRRTGRTCEFSGQLADRTG
jgi:hypothetical protein